MNPFSRPDKLSSRAKAILEGHTTAFTSPALDELEGLGFQMTQAEPNSDEVRRRFGNLGSEDEDHRIVSAWHDGDIYVAALEGGEFLLDTGDGGLSKSFMDEDDLLNAIKELGAEGQLESTELTEETFAYADLDAIKAEYKDHYGEKIFNTLKFEEKPLSNGKTVIHITGIGKHGKVQQVAAYYYDETDSDTPWHAAQNAFGPHASHLKAESTELEEAKITGKQRERLDDLITLYYGATDPNADYDDALDVDKILDTVKKEFGSKIAKDLEDGSYIMHFPRYANLGSRLDYGDATKHRDGNRITKAGKLNKQDAVTMKKRIKDILKKTKMGPGFRSHALKGKLPESTELEEKEVTVIEVPPSANYYIDKDGNKYDDVQDANQVPATAHIQAGMDRGEFDVVLRAGKQRLYGKDRFRSIEDAEEYALGQLNSNRIDQYIKKMRYYAGARTESTVEEATEKNKFIKNSELADAFDKNSDATTSTIPNSGGVVEFEGLDLPFKYGVRVGGGFWLYNSLKDAKAYAQKGEVNIEEAELKEGKGDLSDLPEGPYIEKNYNVVGVETDTSYTISSITIEGETGKEYVIDIGDDGYMIDVYPSTPESNAIFKDIQHNGLSESTELEESYASPERLKRIEDSIKETEKILEKEKKYKKDLQDEELLSVYTTHLEKLQKMHADMQKELQSKSTELEEARTPQEGDMVSWKKKGGRMFSVAALDKDDKVWIADDDGEEYEAAVDDLTVIEDTKLQKQMREAAAVKKLAERFGF